jgi:acyl-CoA synthetase (AMP-forming)/AMP-acid ligase II
MPQPDQQNNALEVNNISDCLKFFARVTPDKHALLYPEKITYRELEKKVNACSYGLDHAGIRAGALSLVMVAAGTDFFILTFALLRIGAVPVMIDPGMGTRAMLSVLSGLESEAFIGTSKAHLLPLAFPHVFKKTRILITTGAFRFGRVKRFKNLLTDTHTEYPVYQNDPEEIAAIFFTSGSTGPAKGVIYTTKMLKSQIEITKTLFNIGSDEIDLCTFPLLGLFALCHGNSSVIADMDMMHPAKMDPEKVIRNIRDFRCTQMFGSPMVLN